MIREAIEKIIKRINLTEAEAREVFDEIMSGRTTPAQIGSLLTALRMKGETIEEITGAAKVMREKALRINVDGKELVDTCGTGGSGINTFNISTAAAFVAAGGGAKIAKHGNRSATSMCGSANVLEALGVNINAGPEIVEKCIRDIGIGFLYAPLFHSAMKYASEPRKDIGIRTVFNILGPLSNPANAMSQVIGVYDSRLTEVVANVLKKLGSYRAFVVCGSDGLDEITISGKTRITELNNGNIKTHDISPEKFGIKKAGLEKIKGADVKENAQILLSVLKGEKGPRRDIVVLNASAALVAGSKAKDFKEGIRKAEDSIDSGRAFEKLQRLIEMAGKI